LLADGEVFAFYLDVEFDVFVFAGVFPWVFTVFHVFCPHGLSLVLFAFKAPAETTTPWRGGVSESKSL